jgi:hypothetical protein
MEVRGIRGRRRRKLLDDFEERRGYSHLKEEALYRTKGSARFGRGFGRVVRQTAKWMNESHKRHAFCEQSYLLTPWSGVLLEKLTSLCSSQEIPCIFMEPESSLPHSQVPAVKRKLLGIKCAFWFSLQIVSEIFLIVRITELDMIKNIYWSSCTVPLLLSSISETFEKFSKIKLNENTLSGRRVVPFGP